MSQHQGSVTDQLIELAELAGRAELYDAQDYVKARLDELRNQTSMIPDIPTAEDYARVVEDAKRAVREGVDLRRQRDEALREVERLERDLDQELSAHRQTFAQSNVDAAQRYRRIAELEAALREVVGHLENGFPASALATAEDALAAPASPATATKEPPVCENCGGYTVSGTAYGCTCGPSIPSVNLDTHKEK